MIPNFTDLYRARAELFKRHSRRDAERILRELGAQDLHAVPPERYAAVIAGFDRDGR